MSKLALNGGGKFTPGSWRAYKPKHSNGWVVLAQVSGDSPSGIATIWGLPNAEANAHLIAAAPELYEMLERMLKLRVAGIGKDGPAQTGEEDEAWADVQQLLRKARRGGMT